MQDDAEPSVSTRVDNFELKKVIGNGRTVRIDMNRLSEHTVRVLNVRLV